MPEVLILGKIPPPVGGITVHVRRLIGALNKKCISFTFCDLRNDTVLTIVRKIMMHNVIHIHFSRPVLQLAFALFCRLTFKKLMITYHGQWGRYRRIGNFAVKLSARLATVPIVQDMRSFQEALSCNRHAKLISTFISSPDIDPLPAWLKQEIISRQAHFKNTFCTNAWNVTFDKYGKETYGISDMVTLFGKHPEYLLLISDPSGAYCQYFAAINIQLPANVMFVNIHHDFRSILSLSDAFIRNTSTDGVSLSIHEARELRVPVLASDAVERPSFCFVFEDLSTLDLQTSLHDARRLLVADAGHRPGHCVVDEITAVYQNFQTH